MWEGGELWWSGGFRCSIKSYDLRVSEVPTDFLSFFILLNSYWFLMMLDSLLLDVVFMVYCGDVGMVMSRCDNLSVRVCIRV